MAHSVQRFVFALASILIAATGLFTGCGTNHGNDAAELAKSPDYVAAMGYYDKNQLDSASLYFEKLVKALPENAEGWAWHAEVLRRMGKMDESNAAAVKALALDPKHAFANSVLGNLFNPQFSGWEKADSDTAWMYLTRAIESNPDECNAWITIWIEAMRRGDRKMEQQALERMYKNKFFAEPVLELDKWMMKGLPQNALLISQGDADTYPVRMLQQMEQLRPDIAVVNVNLLNMPWYVSFVAKQYGIPMPMTEAEIASFQPYYDSQSQVVMLSSVILKHWVEMGTALGRPLAFTATFDVNQPSGVPGYLLKGGYYLPETARVGVFNDTTAIKAALDGIDGKRYSGSMSSPGDRSSIRRNVPDGAAAAQPFSAGSRLIRDLLASKQYASAREYIEKMRAFASDAGLGASYLNELTELEKQLK